MPAFYQSTQMRWSSSPKKGVYGTRTRVEVKNGTGVKINEQLNSKGHTLKRKRQTLKRKEIRNVLSGKFIPGFWDNCTLGLCARGKTRKLK